DGKVQEDLMVLQGEALSDRAIEVLGAPDADGAPDPAARPPLPLFADLEQDAFVDLVTAMAYRVYAPGDAIAVQGQGGDSIFVLVAGKAEVARQSEGRNRILGFLGGGSIFGEISLLTGASPTATVAVRDATEVFEIRRDHLNALAKTHPSVPNALAEFAQQRMARNLIATSPVLQQIPEADRTAVLRRFAFRALQSGETALTEGQHSPGVFLVLAGELVVQKEDPAGGAVNLGTLREGDVAGEISLLTGLRATATVVATRKTATAFLERSAFDQLIAEFPQMKSYLEALSNRRLQQIGEALRPSEILDADELVMEPQNEPTPESGGSEGGS
ncbi:MAG TPA: cyclic nucleotide-binding domain-containing protein, partial [Myxococcaceae bacterium]|nr:cyclic nucleotide-binding domain-containing protein [Myxococcaceae bacterium]